MTRPEPVEFVFGRDWIHAGVTYAPGAHARLPAAEAAYLTDLGAGAAAAEDMPHPRRRNTASTPAIPED